MLEGDLLQSGHHRNPGELQYREDCVNILISFSLNLDEGEIFITFTDKTAFFSGREEEAD